MSDKDTIKLPEKLLRIEDLLFILPDEFNGNIIDAIDILSCYLKDNQNFDSIDNNEESSIQALLSNKNINKKSLCLRYGLFEKNGGNYILKPKI